MRINSNNPNGHSNFVDIGWLNRDLVKRKVAEKSESVTVRNGNMVEGAIIPAKAANLPVSSWGPCEVGKSSCWKTVG